MVEGSQLGRKVRVDRFQARVLGLGFSVGQGRGFVYIYIYTYNQKP